MKSEDFFSFAKTCDCNDLVFVIDIICQECTFLHLSFDDALLVAFAVSDHLQTLVVVPGPEERNIVVWHVLAEHVESSVCTLTQSNTPVFRTRS